MASYQTITSSQRSTLNWDDPSAWVGGVVPNAPDADVTLTFVPGLRSSTPVQVTIQPGEAFTARSLGGNGGLILNGTLTVTGAVTQDATLTGGTLAAGSLTANTIGSGIVTVAGALVIPNIGRVSDSGFIAPGYLQSSGGTLSVTAASLDNAGAIDANGAPLSLTVTGGPGAFRQFSAGALLPSGNQGRPGTYQATDGGTLSLNVGGTITQDGAVVDLGSATETPGSVDTIQSFNSATQQYEPLQATLQGVSGALDIFGGQTFAAINPLTVSGSVALMGGSSLAAPLLTVLAGGSLSGGGTITGPIIDNGTISAGPTSASGPLVLAGPVSGSGKLAVTASGVLELGAAASNLVVFQDGTGILELDNPAAFTGTIQVSPSPSAGVADQVLLKGVPRSAITGISYAGTSSGGTLTLQDGSAQQSLAFAGTLSTASFALSGTSNLDITVTPLPVAPTIGLQIGSALGNGLLTNGNNVSVEGLASAGSAVAVAIGGRTAAAAVTPGLSAGVGSSLEVYAATLGAPLAPGLQQVGVTVTAANSAGSAQSTAALNVDLLPAPVNGISTADVSSGDLKALLNQGYGFDFAAGTQALQLTDGTLSLGLDTSQALVQELYEGLLGRSGDPVGLGSDVARINDGTSIATISQEIIDSPEANRFAFLASEPEATFVLQLYHSFLGRDPTSAEQASFVASLDAGTTRGQVAAVFATSPEAARFDASVPQRYAHVWGLDPQGALVTQLYQTAFGRDPELAAVQADARQLSAGLTPDALAQVLASSFEFQTDHNGQSPAAFVTTLYQAGLGRTPGAGEVQGWVDQIASGRTPASITLAIATSSEAAAHLSPSI